MMCSTLATAYIQLQLKSLSYLETQVKQPYSWCKKEGGLCGYDGVLRLSLHCTGKTGPTHFIRNKEEQCVSQFGFLWLVFVVFLRVLVGVF